MKLFRLIVAMLLAACLGASAPPFAFTVPGVDDAPDLHGDPATTQLTIFAAGNQFFVMPALLAAFERAHPEIRRVFYETFPPGIEMAQLRAGSVRIGNLIVSVRPDVVMAGWRGLRALDAAGLASKPFAFASNDLAIEVRAGNPKRVAGLRDLGRPGVRVAMPNPHWEGVAAQISQAFRNAGGAALQRTVMVTKVFAETTILTQIHHRQTPRWIAAGKVDAGVVWASEARYAQKVGLPITTVAIPAAQNVTSDYTAATILNAPHPAAAKAFARFLATPAAYAIYASYGFGPPLAQGKKKHA